MQPPRRPRRWSAAAVGAALRALVVIALLAVIAWPEWHELGLARDTRPVSGTFHRRWFANSRPWPACGWRGGHRDEWFLARDAARAPADGAVVRRRRRIRDVSVRVLLDRR